jgi:monoamine oxidase
MPDNRKYKPANHLALGRSPLFRTLNRALRIASNWPRAEVGEISERVEQAKYQLSRREFLSQSAAWSAMAGLSPALTKIPAGFEQYSRRTNSAKVAIIGAGLAGLNCSHILRQAGILADVYESSNRVGGRIYTATDIMAPELTTELGGEFIDSNHHEIIRIAKLLELKPIDLQKPEESKFEETYVVRGHHYSSRQVFDGFHKAAAIIVSDAKACAENFSSQRAQTLDATPLDQYLAKLPLDNWLRTILSRAYVSEFGLDADQQSSLNLISMLGVEKPSNDHFAMYGLSDEQYRVRGGNEQIVQLLGQRLGDQVILEHALEAISMNGAKYQLAFQGPSGKPVEITADIVILALPFSVLRNIPIKIEMPESKQRAIKELGYGTHTKLMVGFRGRFWRDVGLSGNFFTDEQCQSGWDSSRGQEGTSGSMTLFFGGAQGLAAGQGTATEQWLLLKPGFERVLPGAGVVHNGAVERFCWPKYPHSLGSYSCYKVGQWSAIRGSEATPVGNLYFAGEHCSLDFQGYMNGAAQSGRDVALELLKKLGRPTPTLG